jgi:hypothetical protein
MPLSWNEIRDRPVAFVRDWEDESLARCKCFLVASLGLVFGSHNGIWKIRGRSVSFSTASCLTGMGLLMTFLGAVLTYANSPINSNVIDGGSASSDYESIARETRVKNMGAEP